MRTLIALAVIVASTAVVSNAQAQQRSSGDWWRVGESRLGADDRAQRRVGPRARGFRTSRRNGFDPQVRYDFGGIGLPTWAARAFQPANRR
ncbi:MAG: hypothetical protein AAGG99_09825 [Pseudomonadota bacterium]